MINLTSGQVNFVQDSLKLVMTNHDASTFMKRLNYVHQKNCKSKCEVTKRNYEDI